MGRLWADFKARSWRHVGSILSDTFVELHCSIPWHISRVRLARQQICGGLCRRTKGRKMACKWILRCTGSNPRRFRFLCWVTSVATMEFESRWMQCLQSLPRRSWNMENICKPTTHSRFGMETRRMEVVGQEVALQTIRNSQFDWMQCNVRLLTL